MPRHPGLPMLGATAVALFATLIPAPARSQVRTTAEEFEAKLGYRSGRIDLNHGLATLDVPPSFRFIGPEGSARLLEQAWGNPPGSAEGVLGMLIPSSASPLSREGWGVVITFDDDGYVDDKGAESINYDKLLKQMQDAAEAENKERTRKGYPAVHLLGWAEPPSYNAETHKMYWAKELAFTDNEQHTLNYNVRVLGRRGVLVLTAVAGMRQLDAIKADMQQVLGFVDFNPGHRYADYVPGTDKLATYGVAALVAGGVAAKAGLFKVLLAGLLAAKKLVLAALVALGAAWKKLFSRRRKAEHASA